MQEARSERPFNTSAEVGPLGQAWDGRADRAKDEGLRKFAAVARGLLD
jgi:hypothetical protein